MKVILIGGTQDEKAELRKWLPAAHAIEMLPRDAGRSDRYDAEIGPDDAVVSLQFSRPPGKAPDFRLLHVPGAGLDGIDFGTLPPACTVCNVFEHEIPISEYVLLAMLEWEIRMADMRMNFSSAPGTWPRMYCNRVPHGELSGKTVGLVGFGHIGQHIARRAKAFGMTVLALATSRRSTPELVDGLFLPRELNTLLERSDFVVIACPLTDETRHMIGTEQLRAMKASAVLINVSRGDIVAERPLYEALRDGVIGGACLDVWYRYPAGPDDEMAPAGFPFDRLPNVVCTPHASAWTSGLFQRRYKFIAENIQRVARGERPLNVVKG